MAETALNFGPDWIRALSAAAPSTTPAAAPSMTIPRYNLAEFRYGREEMLALIPKDIKIPNCLKQFPQLMKDKFQLPLALSPQTEEEQRLWRCVNSDVALRASGKPGQGYSMNRPGRGGSVDRGRGRGRGGFYQRGMLHDELDDGPPFSRPRGVERSLSASDKDHRWDDRDRRYDRSFSGRGGIDDNMKQDMRAPNDYWRKYDDDGDWRSGGYRSSDKPGNRGQWRNINSDRDRREFSDRNLPHRSGSGNIRGGPGLQNKLGGHSSSWKEENQGNLPEWSVEEEAEPDTVGTFDSSGAFLETKVKVSENTSLEEAYASDGADEGEAKQASPEAKRESQKKLPKKSPNSSSKQTPNKRNSEPSSEIKNSDEKKPAQANKSVTPKTSSKNANSAGKSSPEAVIKQSTVVHEEKPPLHKSEPSKVTTSQTNVPTEVPNTTKVESVLLNKNVRNSEGTRIAAATVVEDDAFAYHQKATENMVAQWTEEIEDQRVPGQAAEIPPPQLSEKDSKWFYQDPQGEIQGPFSHQEMFEWYNAGYFTSSLMVRRGCDEKFSKLGDLIESFKVNPFMPGSNLPPIRASPSLPSSSSAISAPINPPIAPPTPVAVATPPTVPKQEDFILMQQQLMQRQFLEQQYLFRQAQMQQLAAQLNKQETFTRLDSQQQQQVLMQHLITQQMQMPNVKLPDKTNPLDPTNPLPMPLLGLPLPAMMKNMNMWQPAPGTNAWPMNMGIPQPPGGSIWDVDMPKVNSEESEAEKQKKLAEEQEKARKAEERLEQEREEEKRKEDLRRQQEEARIRQEIQKKEEEMKRLDELKRIQEQKRQEELKRLEEKRRLEEELQRQEELRRLEELQRREEARKQEEQRLLEEKRRQDEEKRQEELRKKEEQRKQQEELKKQQELRKQEEKRKKEELQKKAQMEKQQELERQKEALRQKEMEREEKLRKEKEEAELRRLAEIKKAQGPAWGIQNSQSSLMSLSLADIQRIQEEKEREEREEKMRQQLLQQQAMKQVQQTKNNLSWAKRTNDCQPAVKSLAEIQQEEAERLAQLQKMQKPQAPPPTVNSNVGVWGNSSHLSKITAAPPNWNSNNISSTGFWDEAVTTTQIRKQPPAPPKANTTDSAFPALANRVQPANSSNNKSKSVRAKKEEDAVARLFVSHHKPTDEFTKWCTDAISAMPSSVDVPTFVAFLKDIDSPYEVYDYVKSYFGEGKEPREFSKLFLEKRSKFRNQAKQTPSEDNTLWGPAPAITPTVNKPAPPISIDNDGNANPRGKPKKKKNRMQKIDSSMLGFTVQPNPDRLNVGEIDHVE